MRNLSKRLHVEAEKVRLANRYLETIRSHV